MKQKAKKLIHTIHQLEQIKNNIINHKDNVLVDLDQFPIGICIVNKAGEYVKINKAYASIYGYTKEELLGHEFTMVEPEKDRERSLKEHQEMILLNFNDKGIVSEEIRKNGERVPVAYISCNIYRMTGEAERMYLTADISDIDQTEAQVDEAFDAVYDKIKSLEDKLKSQELAENIFMHDLKKPVRNIQGICQILLEGNLDLEEQQMWVEQILTLSDKIISQADLLRGINQMERGVYQPVRKQIDMEKLLKRIKKDFEPVINSKALEFILEIDASITAAEKECLMADEPYIEKMLSNLVVNALEASPENEVVKMNVKVSYGWIHIHIYNKGEVPDEIKPRFFEKYITSGKDRGTGLGTFIARLIANSMQGDITLDSTTEKGTLITVSLPLTECQIRSKAA